MRISDWSSDLCSSDLATQRPAKMSSPRTRSIGRPNADDIVARSLTMANGKRLRSSATVRATSLISVTSTRPPVPRMIRRSEEHTSELQSLMRISYAVFCLTKKKNKNKNIQTSRRHDNDEASAHSNSHEYNTYDNHCYTQTNT